jgi:hypothetical protein
VIKDDHMAAESETRDSSWLVYATTFAVVLPVQYVLSSGPAQWIRRSDAGKYVIGEMFAKSDLSIPHRQGSFASHWAPPFREIYSPLEFLRIIPSADRGLDWYWRCFGINWHTVEI